MENAIGTLFEIERNVEIDKKQVNTSFEKGCNKIMKTKLADKRETSHSKAVKVLDQMSSI